MDVFERDRWFTSFTESAVDYDNIISQSEDWIWSLGERSKSKCDIAVIVPVYDRAKYQTTLMNHLRQAIAEYDGKESIQVIFIENSEVQKHKDGFGFENPDNKLFSYLWIKKDSEEYFNKSLCHNLGAILFRTASYFLFHDIDTIMPKDFFIKLMANIKETGRIAVQGFRDKRLKYCNEQLTRKFLDGQITYNDDFREYQDDLSTGAEGAPGGSIFINKHIFFKAGGFCPEFFSGYSVEDQFFWNCVELYGTIGSSNNPPIELLHLFHEPSYNKTTKDCDWSFFHTFMGAIREEQFHMTQLRSEHLMKFIPNEA